ncbi:FkbM family methyltransferase [Roseomonas indoligenes]|uniref:FkbM family methyltransferase n=1 Tax=Roseomonas indoligenes TaxID=2820811 RepID=A0A940N4D4_9PROT|nr:FkbM family methyltransferase [Pararoseomonas indoligenes]MBP0494960.1 FkbM family methyltransferase [Pararoseomonas indoligenes]
MPFLSYAQNFEDVLLWRALKQQSSGFYVDVGAADPDKDSVTRAFYDRGWTGINIEPVPEFSARLRAARPRDINLDIAAGSGSGEATLHVVAETGLSTTQDDVAQDITSQGLTHNSRTVRVRSLTDILTEHAPPTIHFLKIDVEGSERAVLEGCDLSLFRPWIVLVEATAPMSEVQTHSGWEGLLTGAGYRFVFFDGLNRYYLSDEKYDVLSRHFQVPVNVFDDFRRAVDQDRVDRGQDLQVAAAISRAETAEASARSAYARGFELVRDLAEARAAAAASREAAAADIDGLTARLHAMDRHITGLNAVIDGLRGQVAHLVAHTAAVERDAAESSRLLGTLRASTSWQVTAPIRAVGDAVRHLARRSPPALVAAETPEQSAAAPGPEALPAHPTAIEPIAEPAVTPEWAVTPTEGPRVVEAVQASPTLPSAMRPLHAVHQFHSGSAYGDAITSAMILVRDLLRGMGYRSDIFVEHRDPRMKDELRLLEELPRHADHVLIVRHSMGHDALERVLASPAPKILLYHNITPPELLAGSPTLQRYAKLGLRQLETIRPHVVAALADSEYNAIALRALGYAPVRACTLLFDLDRLEREAAARPRLPASRPFTVLFTGRVTDAKGQVEVVEAYARFRSAIDRPCQLVLVGRLDGEGTYLSDIDAAMRRHGLEAELVLTGLVSTEELHARFAEADLFLCLSHHEGFGVPLVEAIIHGVPVLAWPSGAIPYTLGGAEGLLDSREPDRVAARMLEIARDAGRRAALMAAQRAAIQRFALQQQLPALHEALGLAGAVPPGDETARTALRPNLRFTVAGHVAGTYSLAAVNRSIALAIEAERPGHVCLQPVEGQRTDDLSGVPAAERSRLAPLAGRGPAETGPEVVISQHYPVHVPEHPGDLPLALLFWEESLLPAATIDRLAAGFRAVLAPTAFVAKALVDSGLPIPVRLVGHAPDLSAMEAIGRARAFAAAPGREGPFTFLHVSSCFPRKGVDILLAAFARAFRHGDPVRLVIKGFPNPHNTVAEDLAALRAKDPGLPAMELIDRDLPEEELLALYRDADAMVLPTRGEGYNLPAAEAMAAGLPLIVTGYGGHMDFCDQETARLLRWRFAPSGSHLATPGSLWIEPDEDDLVDALREFALASRSAEGRAALAERTRRARLQVAQRLRRAPFVERLEEAALDLLLAPPAPPIRVAWVTSWEVRCGVAEYARQLVQAMPEHPGIASHAILPDTRWTLAGRPGNPLAHAVSPAWTMGDPAIPDTLGAAIMAEDPQVVVLQHQPGLIGWALLADLLLGPALRDRAVIVTLHNTQHLLEQAEPGRKAILSALGGADRILVHSIADLERLRTVGLSGNVTLMPHGVKAPLPASAAPARLAGSPVIGSYGFFLPGKGLPELVEAFAILRRTWPEARLRLVNADYGTAHSTDEIARCRSIARTEGIEHAIEWHTEFLPEEEVLDLLAGCTVIALPTQASKESSSASVRDAMAAGPPVLVTPLSIFDEVGDAVIRAEGISPQALAEALGGLLADPARQGRVSAAARGWLGTRAWNLVARRMQGLILGLAATKVITTRGVSSVSRSDTKT